MTKLGTTTYPMSATDAIRTTYTTRMIKARGTRVLVANRVDDREQRERQEHADCNQPNDYADAPNEVKQQHARGQDEHAPDDGAH